MRRDRFDSGVQGGSKVDRLRRLTYATTAGGAEGGGEQPATSSSDRQIWLKVVTDAGSPVNRKEIR